MNPYQANAVARFVLVLVILFTLWAASRFFASLQPDFTTPNPDLPANFK